MQKSLRDCSLILRTNIEGGCGGRWSEWLRWSVVREVCDNVSANASCRPLEFIFYFYH